MTANERPIVLDLGFRVLSHTEHTPTVLVGFAVNDWEARDAFARTLDAAQADGLQQFANDLATRQVDMDPECAAIIAKNFDKLLDAPADPVVSAECWRRAVEQWKAKHGWYVGDRLQAVCEVEALAQELAREGK